MTGIGGGSSTSRIFHLVVADGWQLPGDGDVARDQFERHGFVHCCFREQLVEIATWWFDADDELLALELDPVRLDPEGDRLRLEASPSRWYPHLYRPIPVDAVLDTHLVPRTVDGVADLPPALRQPPPGFQVVDGAGAAVRWQGGAVEGDDPWVGRARRLVDEGHLVPLIGGVVAPATFATAYEAFTLLELTADADAGGIARYDGDGFFEP